MQVFAIFVFKKARFRRLLMFCHATGGDSSNRIASDSSNRIAGGSYEFIADEFIAGGSYEGIAGNSYYKSAAGVGPSGCSARTAGTLPECIRTPPAWQPTKRRGNIDESKQTNE